jgi:hypothetical protein
MAASSFQGGRPALFARAISRSVSRISYGGAAGFERGGADVSARTRGIIMQSMTFEPAKTANPLRGMV